MTQPSVGLDFARIGISGVRLEALFEAVPLAIAIFDGELRLVNANARYRELTGVAASLPTKVSIYDAFPNALADLTDQIDTALRGATIAGVARVPFQHRGGRRLIETTFATLTDESGGRGLLFAGNDVSEREELRETLSRSVAQLESIFDVIPDSVRVFDTEGRTVRSNSQAQQDHPSGQPSTLRELWQLDRPRTIDGTSLFMHEHPTARALRGERVRGETLAVRRGIDGAPVIIEVNSNPLYDEHGKIRGAVTVERDVTVKTQLAKALEEEARRTAELYERVSTEAERLERMVQERTQELLALQEARARERRLAAVGQLAAGVMHDVNNALNPIMAAAFLLEANADNPVAVRDYAVRIAKAAETGAATAALYERVSTEAERLERMVQERTQELLALQEARARERRLAAVGQLAAGVMHDVNNALNPIMAAAFLLEANADNPVAVRDYAVRIAKAAETGAATAARVGRFIRQEPLQAEREEPVDLSVICDEVVAMTRPLWAERARGGTIHLDRNLADVGTVMVRGIAGELREALLNLVQNALDAMAGGGTLGMRTLVTDVEARLEVRDSGIGMSAEVRERAFEPFFTTKGKMGTGLGLAEVYGIVKRHRGRAEIESTPGVGTTIRLVFPKSTLPPVVAAPVEARRQRVARKVLLVEDHPDSREFMQALLESDGHSVDTASGIQDAMALLEHAAPTYEVLVTDIGLADGSGWDLISFARERWPTMRIGVVTGWEPRVGAGTEGDFILRKPVRTSELLAQVAGES